MSGDTANSEKDLLTDLRHRLRTPLNQIVGYGDLLLEEADGLDAESMEQLKTVRAQAHIILNLIQQRLAPGGAETSQEKTAALRREIAGPLNLVIGDVGKLAQRVRGGVLRDVLRLNVASLELLSFAEGAELTPVVAHHVSPAPDFVQRTMTSLPSRLLVVDDEEANCDVLKRQLERSGHAVSCVMSGAEALSRLRSSNYDLVLLDVMMPELSGFQVLERMKDSAGLCDVPVIMMSALDERDSAAHCIQMGAEDYMLKPFDPILLRARVHSALERKRLHEQEKEHTAELEVVGQNLKRANEDLNRFAFAASHDLQEPLRTITTMLQLMSTQLDGAAAKQGELLDWAIDASRRMSRLIEDLLAYSLANSKARVVERVNCEDALRNALNNLRLSIEESGCQITHDALPEILFDRVQLSQLFQNLVGNAIKYRGEKTPAVHVSASSCERLWVFSVRDNGMGIAADYRRIIFEPFQRLHGQDLPGTGLGLAICARIVEGSGGRIWVESEVGNGSTFLFSVPEG